MDQSQDGIVVLTQEGSVHSANQRFVDVLGYSKEELLRLQIRDFDEHIPFEKIIFMLDAADNTGIRFESVHQRKDGSVLDVEISTNYAEYKDKQLIICVCRNITKRKQAEQALRESEKRFRTLVDQAVDAFTLFDTRGRILDVNKAACDSLGYTREELLNMSIQDVDLMAEPTLHRENFWDSAGSGKSFRFESRLRRKNGTVFPVEVSLGNVELDHQKLMLGLSRDITERRRTEDSVRKLSHAIEQSPVSIVITDITGKIEFVNTRFTHVSGYSREEVLGRKPNILKSGVTHPEEYRRLWETISSGGIWRGQFHNRKKNGDLFWERATIAPIRNSQNVITHYVAVKEDITEHKQLEEELRQAQKMEAIGQLAGGVAHDFNNMLGVILGSTEMSLDQMDPSDPIHASLQVIRRAAERSADLTRQLLAFARKQTIAPRVLDLNETIEGMLKMLRRLIGEDIDLAWFPATKVWPVKVDPSQIDQILANLSVNARDAISGVGKVTIETNSATFDNAYCAEHAGFVPGDFVMMAVSDNGCGMDRQALNKLFEPFYTTKSMGKGTGLGLATVYGIVKQNNGFINVYSEPGHGATFKIYLPRHATDTDHIESQAPAAPAARGDETILLVEDEPALLSMGRKMLQSLGYRVLTAAAPSTAINMAKEHPGEIHLLITDVIMPEMNGRELEKQLISLHPQIATLFMSGYTGNIIAHHGMLDEGVNFIEKPFSKQILGRKVRELMDKKR